MNDLDELYPREREVLRLYLSGYTGSEIARLLNIEIRTALNYLQKTRWKLGIFDVAPHQGRRELTKWALENHVLQLNL